MSGKGGRRSLSDEDRQVWDVFTKPIKPLAKSAPRPEPAADPNLEPKPKPAVARPRQKGSPPVAPPIAAPKAPPPLASLGRREKSRVAKGRTEIDGRLDLHGHTQAEAHDALRRFLDGKHRADARLVLVITGKSGVLRRQVPLWLGLPELRPLVIGFEPAAARHGGDGALYVRLRRGR